MQSLAGHRQPKYPPMLWGSAVRVRGVTDARPDRKYRPAFNACLKGTPLRLWTTASSCITWRFKIADIEHREPQRTVNPFADRVEFGSDTFAGINKVGKRPTLVVVFTPSAYSRTIA